MKRFTILALAALLLAALPPTAAMAKTFTVSVNQFVEHPALDAALKGFQDYLKERGVDVEYKVHNAQANMATANQIAQAIAGERPDLVYAIATPSAQTCAQIVKKAPHMAEVPLIFAAVTDPAGAGLVRDIAAPGANVTGVSDMTPVDKHVDMIMEFIPSLKELGVVYNSGEANSKTLVDMLRKACTAKGVTLVEATASKTADVYQATKSLGGRVQAVYAPTDNTVVAAIESMVKVCQQNSMPLFAADVGSVPRGAVAALGFDYYLHGRQAGAMAERILVGGQTPAATPVEFQEGMTLHLNLPAAKAQGVEIPEALKARADKIIE
ncbi:putative ABC transport system substrate-binding protein [Desulfobaculum xiamenense]|uniref:Putative ABC transport system substrate-binding protein n=1 Tax=Desulfobaculum xiamenense TaxID=995050 RepID=A0A846QPJ0_9BACT|nr:ABC transporter substrate-binding protein [Desulfobaculum xiamenense]NJB67134.1 putative ABC transport system substrate-binding protein [Desulfobaculum xiamenense]